MWLRCVSVITVLAVGLMTAGGASAKKRSFVFTEEGVPVPVSAEVTVGLEMWTKCARYRQTEPYVYYEPMQFQGHMAVNSAQTNLITFSSQESNCDEASLYPAYVYGSLKEISMTAARPRGKAVINASLVMGYSGHAGAGEAGCAWHVNTLAGRFPIPGYARVKGKARGTLGAGSDETCGKTTAVDFTAAMYGPNGKLLETAPVG
jgi:hypothetical protein